MIVMLSWFCDMGVAYELLLSTLSILVPCPRDQTMRKDLVSQWSIFFDLIGNKKTITFHYLVLKIELTVTFQVMIVYTKVFWVMVYLVYLSAPIPISKGLYI